MYLQDSTPKYVDIHISSPEIQTEVWFTHYSCVFYTVSQWNRSILNRFTVKSIAFMYDLIWRYTCDWAVTNWTTICCKQTCYGHSLEDALTSNNTLWTTTQPAQRHLSFMKESAECLFGLTNWNKRRCSSCDCYIVSVEHRSRRAPQSRRTAHSDFDYNINTYQEIKYTHVQFQFNSDEWWESVWGRCTILYTPKQKFRQIFASWFTSDIYF